MSDFIQFGWDAIGFLAALFVSAILVAIVLQIIISVFEWLANWAEKNGWN